MVRKNYKIRGIFMQADIKNRNGRVYPMEVLQKKKVNIIRILLKKIGHLVNLDIQTGQQSILERVSHMITSLKPDGKNFIGEG